VSAARLPAESADAADSLPAVPREFRAVWVATVDNIDWPSRPGLPADSQRAELVAILDRAVELNLNAIILQVRPAGDALYPSSLEPWSEYLTGRAGAPPSDGYDPLRFAVDEAHRRGLELHAWFNPYRARQTGARSPVASTHVSVAKPELVRRYGSMQWMDPGEPATAAHSLAVILDVVKRYDVDGIHLDDYFYPYAEIGPDSTEIPFPDSASYARYVRGGGTLARNDWRRENVNMLIRDIYRRTKALKPWVKVGISPFGIWRPGTPPEIAGFDAYDRLYADSRKWLREGWVDYFVPQLYWPIAQTAQSYPTLLRWWMGENVKNRHVWPGHNASRAAGTAWLPDELLEQVRLTRAANAGGDIHFSMRALMPANGVRRDSVLVGVATQPPMQANAAALADRLRTQLYAEPALVPPSPWLSRARPARPAVSLRADSATTDMVVRLGPGDSRRVAWWTVRVLSDGAWRTWILPGAQRRLTIPTGASAAVTRVLVTAVDRYGTESVVVERPAR
jgi:uncharacterized lipoprotein YddW (UPF0748 family)